MANQHLQRLNKDRYPYITFDRVMNEHMEDEYHETWKCYLFDDRGSIFAWVDVNQIQFYIKKGWKIVDYGNFDVRKPDGSLWEELFELEGLVSQAATANKQLKKMQDDIAQLRNENLAILRQRDPSRLAATKMSDDDADAPNAPFLHSYPADVHERLTAGDGAAAGDVFEKPGERSKSAKGDGKKADAPKVDKGDGKKADAQPTV